MTDTTVPAAPNPPEAIKQPPRPKLRDILGPGLITGASDDDPSGIATYSQAGAQFGYQLGWTWTLVAVLVLVGVVFTIARARNGSVFASYLLHLGYNSLIALLALVDTSGFTNMPKPH